MGTITPHGDMWLHPRFAPHHLHLARRSAGTQRVRWASHRPRRRPVLQPTCQLDAHLHSSLPALPHQPPTSPRLRYYVTAKKRAAARRQKGAVPPCVMLSSPPERSSASRGSGRGQKGKKRNVARTGRRGLTKLGRRRVERHSGARKSKHKKQTISPDRLPHSAGRLLCGGAPISLSEGSLPNLAAANTPP